MAQQKSYRMSELARGQDERWIRQQYNRAIKAANDRIKTVTKPGSAFRESAHAYKHLVEADLKGAPYVKERGGATVFKALPRGSSRGESLEALRRVEAFLGAKTSTVRGIKAVEKSRKESLDSALREQMGPDAPQLTDAQKDAVLRWMGSDEGKEAKTKFDSHQVREAISKAVIASGDRDPGIAGVMSLYEDFEQSQQTMADWIYSSEELIASMAEF